MISTLPEVLATLELDQVNQTAFVGAQLDGPGSHIVGGHITAQALVAAVRTVKDDRAPRAMQAQFLRSGDAREPVDFEVAELHDGGTFSTRRVTARQFGSILMEATVSFSTPAEEDPSYQPPMPTVAQPDSLASVPLRGTWSSLEWFERRNIADATARASRLWWRPNGAGPDDPALATALIAYLSAVTPVEAAMAARNADRYTLSPMLNHSVWFHQPADLSDWVLYEQESLSGAQRLALVTGRMFSRAGRQLCTATQEFYFPPARGGH